MPPVRDLRDGIGELVRPGATGPPGETVWRPGRVVMVLAIVVTNLVGAAAGGVDEGPLAP